MKKYYWLFILFISDCAWANRYMEDRYDGYGSGNHDFIVVIGYFCYCFWAYKSFFKCMNNKEIALTAIGSFLTTWWVYTNYFHDYNAGIMGCLVIIGPFVLKCILSKDR